MCDFFLGVLVLFVICSIIMSGLLGKVVEYVQSPTEEERFYNDVYNHRYHGLVGNVTRNQSARNAEINARNNEPVKLHSFEYVQAHQNKPSSKIKSIRRHRQRHGF